MPYRIELKPAAIRDLRKVPRTEQRRIARKIDALASNPRPRGAKKLEAQSNLWRIRVGDYRVVYQPQGKVLLVLVVRVLPRGKVYQVL